MSDFERLARELEAHPDPLVASTLERLRQRVPASPDEIRDFVHASVRAQLHAFRRADLPESCPEVDATSAKAAARVGGLKVLLTAYQACQVSLGEAWLDLVESSVAEPGERRELLKRGSDFFFRYAGLLSDYVADIYQDELERAVMSGDQRRFHAIKGLLDGDPLALSLLDFDLNRHHLGLIAWGEDAAAAARQLAEALERPLLSVGPLERTQSCWAWISGAHPLNSAEERSLKGFEPATGRVALGLEAFGEAGFRATHRQALRVRRFAVESSPPLLRYEDVAVEALASENEDDARAFVAHELRGIGDDSAVSRRIRETLAAYFAVEHNAASAAATLGIHQQTVANRIRTAEERLGHTIGARRVELELALRLRRSLGSGHAADQPGLA
jgi:hypothetical protein